MKKLLTYAVYFFVLLTITTYADELRTWTSSTGQTMEAEFIGISEDGKSVTLRRNDGKEGNVVLDKLSSADKSYVARQKRALDQVNAQAKKVDEERKLWESAIDFKEELKNRNFGRNLIFFAQFGTVELQQELDQTDAFGVPKLEAKINASRKEIAQKTFVVEFTATECLGKDKRNIDIKVNGNKSSFEMLIPLGLKCSKVRAISFPWTNMTGDVARARAS